ncbi:hypothetical protein M3Y96_00607000 [Aphelenchoides besseyi]|nr:hypothetical protein M3Y96_00607000 [Aphelenchoides besseyi]
MNETIAEFILEIEPIIELCISLPTLLVNLYFAFRFSQLDCFSPNFRILLVMTNIMTSLCTVVHPLPQLFSKEFYSVEKGNYGGAILVYGLHFIGMIFLMIIDSKYLMIAMERRIAFKHRVNYESRDGRDAIVFLSYYLGAMFVLIFIKTAAMFYFSTEDSIDKRLHVAFVPEYCIYIFAPTTGLAFTTWILGSYQFYKLSRFAAKYRYRAQSLSESFLIKQIAHVVDIMLALLVAYVFAVLFSGTCMFIILYLYFHRGHSTSSTYYLIFANLAYFSVPFYTLFSTIYQMYYFPAMRRVIILDLKRVFGIELEMTIHPQRSTHEEETRMYFSQLKQLWS